MTTNSTTQKSSKHIKILSLSTAAIAIVLVGKLFVFSSPYAYSKSERKAIELGSRTLIPSISMPSSMTFAGEEVPLNNQSVKESLDRELLVNAYWQSQTILFIKRADRFCSIIEPILKEQGVPDDFKYLSLIESGYLPRALSGAGAAGLWQFMEGTGKEYSLEVTREVDERYNIEKSTLAACKYLKKSKEKLGSWTLAAAAYNAGSAGIDNQLEKQKSDSYYSLFLNEETGRYVYRILAAKLILSYPEKFGFLVDNSEKYPVWETKNIEINTSIPNLAQFAIDNGVTYKELKDLNPWLRDNALTNSNSKKYTIKLLQNKEAESNLADIEPTNNASN